MTVAPGIASLVANLTASPTTSFAELMHRVTGETAPPPAPGPPLLPETDAALMAAFAESFTLDELGLAAISEGSILRDAAALVSEDRAPLGDERAIILANAQPALVAGQRRLRLTDRARGDLLRRMAGSKRYDERLEAAGKADIADFDAISGDPVRLPSAWLRSYLRGSFGDVRQAPPTEVRAAVAALESLRDFPHRVGWPDLDAARRALDLSELLEPLRILIGLNGGWNNAPVRDRFAGRTDELRRLRAFVDEIESEGALESVARTVTRTIRRGAATLGIARAELLTIVAQGGLGKSALMAKFVLQHAIQGGESSFPFVYIDFDRASVRPAEPAQLLLETLRQLGLQYPVAASEFDALSQRVLSEAKGTLTQIADRYSALRALVRKIAGPVTFLVILDTVEVAQYNPKAVAGIDRFLCALVGNDDFPELRIVAAGRAELGSEMRVLARVHSRPPVKLKPLSVAEAAEMAALLGRSLPGRTWRDDWARRIAGPASDNRSDRREPLSIRVAVDWLSSADPANQEALSREIEALGETADASFVARIYQRRILEHVRDDDVRKLAWPGLAVRDVTVDIIRDLLAEPCGLDPAKAEAVFANLAREVWIVETRTEEGVTVLRHKRELRARTLPLMRRYVPESVPGVPPPSFEKINSRAITYFGARAADPAAAAEWIYHRLLGGEPPEQVDADWRDEFAPLLADAPEDFSAAPDRDPAMSAAGSYLLGRTATTPLAPVALARLPAWLAFEHAANVAPVLAGFGDRILSDALLDLSSRGAPERPLSPAAQTARRTLLIKAGRWIEPLLDMAGSPTWRAQAAFAASYRRARSAADRDAPNDPSAVRAVSASPLAYRWLAQEVAAAAVRAKPGVSSKVFDALDTELALEIELIRAPFDGVDLGSLRVAAIFGRKSCLPAARLWMEARRYVTGTRLTCSAAELRMLGDLIDKIEISEDFRTDLTRLFDIARQHKQPLRIEGGHFSPALDLDELARSVFAGLGAGSSVIAEDFTRRYFALSRHDWLVPISYAAARAIRDMPDTALAPVADRSLAYDPDTRGLLRRLASAAKALERPAAARDVMVMLRRADEASDLFGMARLYLNLAGDHAESRDLARLIDAEQEWSEAIAVCLGDATRETAASPHAGPPPPGPVRVKDDPQNGRWGGSPMRDGRMLRAVITDASSEATFDFDLFVEASDGGVLEPPVVFHLHDTFSPSVLHIRRIQDQRRCAVYRIQSTGAFTIGAQVRRTDGVWISLELDLVDVPGLPARFHDR